MDAMYVWMAATYLKGFYFCILLSLKSLISAEVTTRTGADGTLYHSHSVCSIQLVEYCVLQ